jgi:hypothetical protein
MRFLADAVLEARFGRLDRSGEIPRKYHDIQDCHNKNKDRSGESDDPDNEMRTFLHTFSLRFFRKVYA